MSVGTTVDVASLGAPPPNVVVRPHVPQLEVLRRASIFVSHGGMNSVSESLHFGVPLVCVPQMGEQEIVARQVEALGAGVHLAKEEATVERIRECVGRVLGDESFRTGAAVMRQSFQSAGGAARGAEAILAFTRSRAAREWRAARDERQKDNAGCGPKLALGWLKQHGTRAAREGMSRYNIPSDRSFGVPMTRCSGWRNSSAGATSGQVDWWTAAGTKRACWRPMSATLPS